MPVRWGNFVLVLAMFTSIGGHWLALQSVAWTAMLADHMRQESFAAALKETFDGRHPCALCQRIAAGKKSEQKTELAAPVQKFEFPPASAQLACFAPTTFAWQSSPDAVCVSWSQPPPVPPPRAAGV
jgi:hypothetical protein